MGGRSAAIAGETTVLSTTGSNQLMIPVDCTLLGFWLSAAATVQLFDAASAAAAATINQILPSTVIPAVGWYPFPATCVRGLVANISAGTLTAITC